MKIICIGRNYTEHIEELGNERPDNPVIFMKPDTAILKDNAPFYYPEFSKDIHHEVEVLVKIKKEGKSISPEFAHKYYDEIGLGIDFTARDVQSQLKEKGQPWERAKAFNGSAPISKFISKAGFDLQKTGFELKINGQTVQNGNTSLMLWPINELIAYVSKFFTLKTGDIIFTGTPKGVGPVSIGDELVGFLEGQEMFRFQVK
ncbi:fumarylacetoacetate hydrolase family protein [Marinoscillum sp. MHG1-6]|uniref:fumarylacetoacetate hydrolase family protein n=1 Tax=Marinoscillum sp. MHG1-6 TaxID=2959627 RepID=UPI0021580FB7|nr:fumarylacetoacetate hydrolase family protein [Marinoscillum sp. MHG1-6]